MARYGRQPDQMRILPGLTAVVGRTQAEAQEKWEFLQSLIDPVQGREFLTMLLGVDLSGYDIDGPLPDLSDAPNAKSGGTFRSIVDLARRENLTIRQIYERLAGSRGKLTLIGSVTQVADTMQEWFEGGACDGFILQPSYLPGELDEFCDLLVPELRNRGLVRTGYDGKTLRDNLGLARPSSRYTGPNEPTLAAE
jgi:alkanesulfonate monooxygenase